MVYIEHSAGRTAPLFGYSYSKDVCSWALLVYIVNFIDSNEKPEKVLGQ